MYLFDNLMYWSCWKESCSFLIKVCTSPNFMSIPRKRVATCKMLLKNSGRYKCYSKMQGCATPLTGIEFGVNKEHLPVCCIEVYCGNTLRDWGFWTLLTSCFLIIRKNSRNPDPGFILKTLSFYNYVLTQILFVVAEYGVTLCTYWALSRILPVVSCFLELPWSAPGSIYEGIRTTDHSASTLIPHYARLGITKLFLQTNRPYHSSSTYQVTSNLNVCTIMLCQMMYSLPLRSYCSLFI